MKRFLGIFAFLATVALIDYGIYTTISQQVPPPSILLYPTNGTVVSGVINLEAIPMNWTSRTVRVDFYRDGILFKSVTNMAPNEVRNLQVTK